MQSWQMDMLCQACTGAGISKRKLYTDEEEVILKFWRCVVLNGIYPGATKPDILDRVLPLYLTRLTKAQNKTKQAFWADFEPARASWGRCLRRCRRPCASTRPCS
jgi:hypothetical protein